MHASEVLSVPHFPIVPETNVRKGFLSDEQCAKLRDELPPELKPLFVTRYENWGTPRGTEGDRMAAGGL